MTEVREAAADDWWVMGDAEGNYLHWKANGISGCYVQSASPEDAERFDTEDEAAQEIELVLARGALSWGGGEILPLKVTKTVRVFADL